MNTTHNDRAPRYRFFGICALLSVSCAALTAGWHDPWSAMARLPMCGGSMMPMPDMMWLRMPGQTWAGAAASFLYMWMAMMTTMMLPAVAPALWPCRRFAALAAAGYFVVWAAAGAVAYPWGAAAAALQLHHPVFARAAPFMTAVIVAAAGALQFTGWKARHLAGCRHAAPGDPRLARAGGAWRHGARLGWHCVQACTGWTAVLLVTGMMNPIPMIAAAIAIAAERLAPNGVIVARAAGALLLLAGLSMMARAALA